MLSSAMRRLLLLSLFAFTVRHLHAQSAESRSCIEVDTTVAMYHDFSGRDADSVRAVIDSLESRARAASAAELPHVLMALGRAKSAYQPNDAYGRAHETEYFYNEIAGSWLYTGAHYQQLIDRFPASDLADDAAYQLTLLVQGGECEGYIACYVHSGWHRVAEFLRQRPASPLASRAAMRALRAFRTIEPGMDLRGGSEYIEPGEIRKLVAELDSVGSTLRATPFGARLYARSGELWQQLGEYDFARVVFRGAMPGLDAKARACVAARLAAMPTRVVTLDPIRVIHPGRVEVNWTSVAGATTYVVHRSGDRLDDGPIVAQLPATAVGWVDTTTTAATTHWYRVVAHTDGGTVESIPASAEVPSTSLEIATVSVSTADSSVYIFGHLSNGFPQVVRVRSDGSVAGRIAGYRYGTRRLSRGYDFRPYVGEVFLSDDNGTGVLRYSGSAQRAPADLRAAIRRGADLLEGATDDAPSLAVSVDEPGRGAWIERAGGAGASGTTVMDCLGARALCWIGGSGGVKLVDSRGGVLAHAQIPRDSTEHILPRAIHADPADTSAWVFLRDQGRLLHVDRAGAVRHDVRLIDGSRAYSLALTADFDRRAIWFARRPRNEMQLVRIDLNSPQLAQRATRLELNLVRHMVPDLTGGLWIIARDHELARVDGLGRITRTITLGLPR